MKKSYLKFFLLNGLFPLFLIILEISCAAPVQTPQSESSSLPEGYSSYIYIRSNSNPQTFYFDSVSGNNSNSGISEGSPLKDLWTLDYIDLVPGDNIKLKKGSVWTNNWIHITESGTSSQHIKVSVYGAGEVPSIKAEIPDQPAILLDGKYIDIDSLLIAATNHAPGIQTGTLSKNILIDNCEIKNSGIGVVFRGSDHQLQNTFIHDLKMIRNTIGGDDDYGANGVFIEGSNIKILHNRFINCKAVSYDYGTDGGTVELWRNCSNIEIAYNWSQRNNGFMEIGGKNGDSVSSIKVHHNLILNDIVIFLPHISGGFSIYLSDVKYENNTVIVTENNYDYSLFMAPNDSVSSAMLSVKNNIFYTVYPNRIFKMGSGSTFIHQYNLYNRVSSAITYNPGDFVSGQGEITGANAGFISLLLEDFHLQSGSDGINAGENLGYSVDFDGNSVPKSGTADIGCYESSY